MAEALDSPSSLQTQLTIGRIGLVTCGYFIVFVLKKIDLNTSLLSKKKPRFDATTVGHDTELNVSISFDHSRHKKSATGSSGDYMIHRCNDDDNYNDNDNNNNDEKSSKSSKTIHTTSTATSTSSFTTLDTPGHSSELEAQIHNLASNPHDYMNYTTSSSNPSYSSSFEEDTNTGDRKFIRSKLSLNEKLYLYIIVSILLFITYLLLVYLPSGSIMTSLFASFLVFCLTLKQQVYDDVLRRKRYDRISAILTLVIFAAAFMSLMTYGSVGLQEGVIYEGPARIIGYDTSIYETSNGSDGDKFNRHRMSYYDGGSMLHGIRMDLEVAWGGQWGCPDNGGVQCQAFVSGALCEIDQTRNNNNNDESVENQNGNVRHYHQRRYLENDDDRTTLTATNTTIKFNNNETATIEELETEVEELKEENEKLKKEKNKFKKENDELNEENNKLDQVVSKQSAEVDSMEELAVTYYDKANDEKAKADYYKDVAVEEAEEVIVVEGDALEEEVNTEYYAKVVDEEENIIENEYGLVGEEVVDEVKEEVRDDLKKAVDAVEDVMEETLETIEDAYVNDDIILGDVEVEVEEAEEKMIDTLWNADDEGGGEEESAVDDDVTKEIIEDEKEDEKENLAKEEEVLEGLEKDTEDGYIDDLYGYELISETAEEIVKEVEEDEEDGILNVEEGEEIVKEVEEKAVEVDVEVTPSTESYYNRNHDYYADPYIYSFEDDMFEDDWWLNSWTDVWGEYSCSDIFDADLEGKKYDSNVKPGNDGWPFVNIYGSCNSCEAYLVDYYSTEHFNMIKQYQNHARNYAFVGVFGVIITFILAVKQCLSPSEENDLGLLMNEGGDNRMMV